MRPEDVLEAAVGAALASPGYSDVSSEGSGEQPHPDAVPHGTHREARQPLQEGASRHHSRSASLHTPTPSELGLSAQGSPSADWAIPTSTSKPGARVAAVRQAPWKLWPEPDQPAYNPLEHWSAARVMPPAEVRQWQQQEPQPGASNQALPEPVTTTFKPAQVWMRGPERLRGPTGLFLVDPIWPMGEPWIVSLSMSWVFEHDYCVKGAGYGAVRTFDPFPLSNLIAQCHPSVYWLRKETEAALSEREKLASFGGATAPLINPASAKIWPTFTPSSKPWDHVNGEKRINWYEAITAPHLVAVELADSRGYGIVHLRLQVTGARGREPEGPAQNGAGQDAGTDKKKEVRERERNGRMPQWRTRHWH